MNIPARFTYFDKGKYVKVQLQDSTFVGQIVYVTSRLHVRRKDSIVSVAFADATMVG